MIPFILDESTSLPRNCREISLYDNQLHCYPIKFVCNQIYLFIVNKIVLCYLKKISIISSSTHTKDVSGSENKYVYISLLIKHRPQKYDYSTELFTTNAKAVNFAYIRRLVNVR